MADAILAATEAKLTEHPDADPFLVALALALARLMDTEPTSAVAKELRAVVDLIATRKDSVDLPDFIGAASLGNAKKP
jgi:hypothetical protein